MTDPASDDAPRGDRIAKVLARAGLCSRREAERWIEAGRVTVDGEKLSSPAFNVPPGATVLVDGRPLRAAEATRLWRFHKPDGCLTTRRDPAGRPTIYHHLPSALANAITVGRLDMTSEGLLLLTNDGELARRLELPATGWTRRYRARVHGRVDEKALATLKDGVTVDGVRYGPITAKLESQAGANAWVSIALAEGKNREVRRVMEHLGYPVNRLIRIAYGPFQLGKLPRGKIEEVPPKVLAEQLPKKPPPAKPGSRK
ncbi:MAG: pseudouridine synthase [Alphaproteobacteria bacterium]|jgi:23S rRNA pseudouridine2605 synthase